MAKKKTEPKKYKKKEIVAKTKNGIPIAGDVKKVYEDDPEYAALPGEEYEESAEVE